MVLITKLIVLAASAGHGLACVHATGYIQHDVIPGGPNEGLWAELWDNGDRKCQGVWGIDQDGHYSVSCVPGYYYAFSQNGAHAWYGYGSAKFEWSQAPDHGHFDCYPCGGKSGNCAQCSYVQWDNWLWGC